LNDSPLATSYDNSVDQLLTASAGTLLQSVISIHLFVVSTLYLLKRLTSGLISDDLTLICSIREFPTPPMWGSPTFVTPPWLHILILPNK